MTYLGLVRGFQASVNRLAVLVALLATLSGTRDVCAEQCHVILAADARSNLPGFKTTVNNITILLEGAKRKGVSIRVTSLPENEVGPNSILSSIRGLAGAVDAADSILFYYIGHGGTMPGTGHVLRTSGGDLLRSEVRFSAEGLGVRGVCLLTDCCSVEIKGKSAGFAPVLSPIAVKLFEHLFLRSKGTVDITAATFDPSVEGSGKAFYTGRDGGLFTQSVFMTVLEADRYYHQFGENLFSWDTYFGILKARVNESFIKMRQFELSIGNTDEGLKETLKQEPMAFQLGGVTSKDGAITATELRPGKRPRLGAVVHTSYGYGVIVNRTAPNGAAENIIVDRVVDGQTIKSFEKLLPGDIIVSANGTSLKTIDDLFDVIDRVAPGGELRLEGIDKSTGYSERYRGVIRLP